MVRCFTCNGWFNRLQVWVGLRVGYLFLHFLSHFPSLCKVGISKCAYQQLVQEQFNCAWSCDECITSKNVQSMLQNVPSSERVSTNHKIELVNSKSDFCSKAALEGPLSGLCFYLIYHLIFSVTFFE